VGGGGGRERNIKRGIEQNGKIMQKKERGKDHGKIEVKNLK
jgi:hypothetical protein